MINKLTNTFYFLALLSVSNQLTVLEIRNIFGDKYCIPGSALDFRQTESIVETNKQSLNLGVSINDVTSHVDEDKSAMSSVHELSQYNKISYSYELINEQGPAHSKVFTLVLYLGDEQYNAEGKSLKTAQRIAASTALKSTQYQHPPLKINENEKSLTPTVLLNNLCAKLGLAVKYGVITNDILEELESHDDSTDTFPKKSYLQRLNDTVYSNGSIHIRKDTSDNKGPFTVQVMVNDVKFKGKAHTVQNAKHEAALNALKYLKENKDSFSCLKDDGCKQQRQAVVKSPISLVYEAAQKRNMLVEFEIINEEGPAHKKSFTTRCTAGDLTSTGTGKSKKESKKLAAENILPSLNKIPEVKDVKQVINSSKKKDKRRNKKNKVVKTTFDKIDRMLDNVMEFGKSLFNKAEDEDSTDEVKPKKNKKVDTRSASDEILILGKILQLEMQYSDFSENTKHYALLDLGTKPSFVCLGEGVNKKNSRDLAAKHGINVLYKLGLLDNILGKSSDISSILDKEESYQKLILEVVDTKEERNEL
ncbi:maternal effect protein staufen-like isoform X1 [Sitophilus oryzae]|uniref:Maternal effect protein staufen-like isoform X1 n=1 Tax=Sitophilus oryzae TaxID=7048 RepID=A0A6J2Y9P0_SITOR|nr:maternal effect protein staufen-like isoform X1 [Sitophilus oryzae]